LKKKKKNLKPQLQNWCSFCKYIKYQQKNTAHDFNKNLYFLMKTMIYTLPHEKKKCLDLGFKP